MPAAEIDGIEIVTTPPVIAPLITGAITMQKSPDNKITIQIDKEEVAEDARHLIDEGKEVLHKAEAALQDHDSPRQQ